MNSSRLKVVFEFENGLKIYGELSRIYAPSTVNRMIRSLPLDGRVQALNGWIYFTIDLTLKPEKPRRTCEPGWIAYWPLSKAVCLFYRRVSLGSPVNRMGNLLMGFNSLSHVASGVRVRFKAVKQSL